MNIAGLLNFQPNTAEVALPNGASFPVRGLNFEDICTLLRTHYPVVSNLFDKYVVESVTATVNAQEAGKKQISLTDIESVVTDGLAHFPVLMTDVLARATGAFDPGIGAAAVDVVQVLRSLPIGTQIDAVEKVLRLTLEAEGGMEKLMGTVTALLGSVKGLPANRSPSKRGRRG